MLKVFFWEKIRVLFFILPPALPNWKSVAVALILIQNHSSNRYEVRIPLSMVNNGERNSDYSIYCTVWIFLKGQKFHWDLHFPLQMTWFSEELFVRSNYFIRTKICGRCLLFASSPRKSLKFYFFALSCINADIKFEKKTVPRQCWHFWFYLQFLISRKLCKFYISKLTRIYFGFYF